MGGLHHLHRARNLGNPGWLATASGLLIPRCKLSCKERVVFNNLLQIKRSIARGPVIVEGPGPDGPEPESADGPQPAPPEQPVLDIILTAIQAAFRECDPEEFVLLNLAHANGLKGRELAELFGCSEAKISCDLDAARNKIKVSIVRHVKERDQWLEIQWEDFVEL